MIGQGKKVKFHYTLKVDGQVFDKSADAPLEYVHGQGSIIRGLEKAMEGMKEGDKKTVRVPCEEGYGTVQPEAIVEFPKARAPQDVQVGAILAAKRQDGQSLRGRVVEIRPETVMIDFNHPLAGKELEFEVDVVSISEA